MVVCLSSGSGHRAVWNTSFLSCCSAHAYTHINYFYPEHGGRIFLRSLPIQLQGYTVRHFTLGLLRSNTKAFFPESYCKLCTEEQMSLLSHFSGCLLEVTPKLCICCVYGTACQDLTTPP